MQESQKPRRTMAQQMDEEYDESERDDIYKRAAEIQAETLFADDDDEWSAAELAAGARGAGISDTALKAAIAERNRDIVQNAEEEKVATKQRAALQKKLLIGGAIVVVIGGLTSLTTQAKLSKSYAQVESARAQVDNTLQRRHDLVPNLINVTKAQLANQRALIAQLEQANRAAQNAKGADKTATESNLTAAISAATSKLQTDASDSPVALRLVDEMAGAENRITQTRRQFNDAAAQYNQKARGFPTTFVRPFLGYPGRIEPLQADVAAREVPKFE